MVFHFCYGFFFISCSASMTLIYHFPNQVFQSSFSKCISNILCPSLFYCFYLLFCFHIFTRHYLVSFFVLLFITLPNLFCVSTTIFINFYVQATSLYFLCLLPNFLLLPIYNFFIFSYKCFISLPQIYEAIEGTKEGYMGELYFCHQELEDKFIYTNHNINWNQYK